MENINQPEKQIEEKSIESESTKISDPMQNSVQPLPTKEVVEIKLINQGSYGCVFRPEITCDDGIGSVNYISKVQLKSDNLNSEILIGEEIQKIRHYASYYAPILQSCPVTLSKISQTEKEKCEILKTSESSPQQESKIISTKIRNVGDKNIESYLKSLPPREDIVIKKIYTTYYHILNGIRKMLEHDIIHYDIKEGNIMYDECNHSPIIIDFGLSFHPSKLKPENYETVFYTDKFYPYWCIEAHILSGIINTYYKKNQQKEIATLEQLDKIVDEYMGNFYIFLHKYAIVPSAEEKTAFENNIDNYIQTLVNKSWENIFAELFKKEIYESWDNFSAAIIYALFYKSLSLNNYASNPTLQQLLALWKSVIFATPNTRKNVLSTIDELSKITLLQTQNAPEGGSYE